MRFKNDAEALAVLEQHGVEEVGNGFLEADREDLSDDCKDAVRYLRDEWDFVFKDLR